MSPNPSNILPFSYYLRHKPQSHCFTQDAEEEIMLDGEVDCCDGGWGGGGGDVGFIMLHCVWARRIKWEGEKGVCEMVMAV